MRALTTSEAWRLAGLDARSKAWADPERAAQFKLSFREAQLRPGVREKRRATMRANNSFRRSGPEERLARAVSCTYLDAQRNVMLNGWEFDIHIPSIATFIQVDGEYWHGLDRPLEAIAASSRPQDVSIHKTHIRDREQNVHCQQHGIRLVRITDREVIALEKAGTVQEWINSTLAL
jgi:hypothetical protein